MVTVSVEGKRGCGYRKKGGLYLIGEGIALPCKLLPKELTVCPTCGAGIKFSRGWTKINPRALFALKKADEAIARDMNRAVCPPCPHDFCPGPRWALEERAGLMWVGAKFYPTLEDFIQEAEKVGISKRIKSVPREFEIGKTWVLLAHIKAYRRPCPKIDLEGHSKVFCKLCDNGFIYSPGIFYAFNPKRVEKVVDEETPKEEIKKLEDRGITPVIVKKKEEQEQLVEV